MKRLSVPLGMFAVVMAGGLVAIFWPTRPPGVSASGARTAADPTASPSPLAPIPAPAEEATVADDPEVYGTAPQGMAPDRLGRFDESAVYRPQPMPLVAPVTGERGVSDTSRLSLASAPVSDATPTAPPADPLALRAPPVRAAISSVDEVSPVDASLPVATGYPQSSPAPVGGLEDALPVGDDLPTDRGVRQSQAGAGSSPYRGLADQRVAQLSEETTRSEVAGSSIDAEEIQTPSPALPRERPQPLAPRDVQPLPSPPVTGATPATRSPLSPPAAGRGPREASELRSTRDDSDRPTAPAGLGDGLPLRVPPGARAGGAVSTVDSRATANRPGSRALEGEQAPSLVVDKWAPAEITVGEPAMFQLRVRNTGVAAAHNVLVVDQVPEKTQLDLSRTRPAPRRGAGGELMWELGTLQPGEDQTIALSLVATEEGEIGSVAQVTFHAQASVRTLATRADLQIQIARLGGQLRVGDQTTLSMTVTNRGTGIARAVMVEVDLPETLAHPAGGELENALGDLRPGDSATMELTLEAAQGGPSQAVRIAVRSQSQTLAQEELPFEVIAPQLQVTASGPKRRYLNRPATVSLTVANTGTAAARNVRVVAALPGGLDFIRADQRGEYASDEHAVIWQLDSLAVAAEVVFELTAMPVEAGDQRVRLSSEAELASRKTSQHVLNVKRRAELLFTVADTADPIEIGSETVYVIEVHNTGTKPEDGIRVTALLSAGLEYLESQGPSQPAVQATAEGQQLVFERLSSLGSQQTAIFRIRVRGRLEGGQVIRVQLSSDQVQRVAVRKEEGTEVYRDN